MVRHFLQKKRWYDYHHAHKVEAQSALRVIESQHGKMNPLHQKEAHDYAHEVLGWSGYAPWLMVYSAVAGSFKSGWIPDNFYGRLVVPRINGLYGQVSGAKSLSRKIFSAENIPDIAYFVNGLFYTATWQVLPECNVKEYLFIERETIVFKLDKSEQGRGIFFLSQNNFSVAQMKRIGNGTFQSYINQHPFFAELISDSVATLRITSVVNDDGKTSARAAYLRLGRKNDTHVTWAANVIIPIDMTTGALHEKGCLPDFSSVFANHPDTGVMFDGLTVPRIDDCFALVESLHKKYPFCRSIGWDVVVDDKDEIKIMEWNGEHNDIKFHEALQGPCFADLGWERLQITEE